VAGTPKVAQVEEKTNFFAGVDHGVEQMQGGDDVVEVVFERRGDGFAHVTIGGEVHHDLNLLLPQDAADQRFVPQVALVEFDARRHRRAMAVDEIVEDHRPVTCGHELPHTMTADVTGPSDDENIHESEPCIAFGGVMASDFRFLSHEARAHRHHWSRSGCPERQFPGGIPGQPAQRGGGHRAD
jgi:hypothetical protein